MVTEQLYHFIGVIIPSRVINKGFFYKQQNPAQFLFQWLLKYSPNGLITYIGKVHLPLKCTWCDMVLMRVYVTGPHGGCYGKGLRSLVKIAPLKGNHCLPRAGLKK